MTWHQLGKNIVKYKLAALGFLAVATLVMGYFAIQVKLSYEFPRLFLKTIQNLLFIKNL